MNKSNETLLDWLYRLFRVSVLASAAILLCSHFFGMSGVTGKHFAVLFLTIGLFLVVKKLNARQRVYALLSIVLFLAVLFGAIGGENVTEWIFAENSFLWVFVLAIAVCGLHLLFEKYFFLKRLFTVMMCVVLLYLLFEKRHVPKTGVALMLLYAVMTLTECVRIASRKNKREDLHAYLVWVTPFLALYFCILCLMPAPETPYSWQWLVNLYLRAEEKISIYVENYVNRNDEDLDGVISGFSEHAALFSNIAADNKNIMVIETSPGRKQPLYLAGKIYDSFDGREWRSTNEEEAKERLFDTIETVYALEEYEQSGPEHPILYHSIRVKSGYRHFRTDYLLAPSKTWNIKARVSYRQRGADFVFDKKAEYGTEYTFQYCRMNMGREAMREFLQSDIAEKEGLWKSTVRRYTEDEITFDELRAYRETVRGRYLKETALTPELLDWIAAVTKDAEDGVDRLFCIEEALANMKYNTNPGGLPKEVTDEQGFLAYFLTENPEGFCTYYATAFVLLARAEGFPARYVQGFCIPMGNASETEVYSSMAHAWPEVYLEGRGWIPFEPTPGYGVRRYLAEDEKTDQKDRISQTQEPEAEEDGLEDAETFEEQREEEQEKLKELRKVIRYLLIGTALILVMGVLFFVIEKMSEKYRDRRRSLGEKYRRAVLRNLQILSMLGYEREPSETYQELVERIREDGGGADIPTEFIETYESILYGTREAGEGEFEECLGRRAELMQILRKKKGRRYWVYWVKLCMM